ncbi:MAG: hypothetical protein IPO41_04115 [Acidobacteria bacterium]|nr:hypothetical protein [Acidobacteriota bacterium]MBK9527504.1 hypothetical protein [Acidobacteriota bacterium]MBP7474771.1 hypothetical protein [Pyrinomonadaceae bacterium]MBP9108878.1 hypothetical protein [Pyrinomonadaceae bacterium]
MKEKHFQILGIAVVAVGLTFIAFLYWSQPRTLAEVATKGSVAIGTYEVNKTEFDAGLAAFRQDQFVAARSAFERADPEKRDAATQFYTAYSYYRQGWGRVSNDDALFKSGLETMGRIDPNFRSVDANLQMKTAAELKFELEEGLKLTASDFNPLKLTKERK